MVLETWKLMEDELKKEKLKKEEFKKSKKENVEFKKQKEKFINIEKSEKELIELKEVLNNSTIDEKTKEILYKAISNEFITEQEIEKIFQKIDEIEQTENIDKYLPKENRITKDEYKKAINDDIFRVQTLTKIKTALTILSSQINPDNWFWTWNLFKWFLVVLDKNLVKIQENHIDIKCSLENIDYKKYWNKLNLWQKIIIFIKDSFKN